MSETLWEELGRLEREARERRQPYSLASNVHAALEIARCHHDSGAVPIPPPVFRMPPLEPRARRRPLWRRLLRR